MHMASRPRAQAHALVYIEKACPHGLLVWVVTMALCRVDMGGLHRSIYDSNGLIPGFDVCLATLSLGVLAIHQVTS